MSFAFGADLFDLSPTLIPSGEKRAKLSISVLDVTPHEPRAVMGFSPVLKAELHATGKIRNNAALFLTGTGQRCRRCGSV